MRTVSSNLNLFLLEFYYLLTRWAKVCMYFLLITQDAEENYKQHEQTHGPKTPKTLASAQESGSELLRTRN